MMEVRAAIAHKLPGRVRLRLAQGRGDGAYFSRLSQEIQDIAAVRAVKFNAATGSVVLEFKGSFEPVAAELRRRGMLIEAPQESPAQEHPVRAAENLSPSKPFHLVTGRKINAMFMFGSLLATVAVVQVARGRVLPPSVSLMWSAMQAFRYSGGR